MRRGVSERARRGQVVEESPATEERAIPPKSWSRRVEFRVDTVGELRRILQPYTDECPLAMTLTYCHDAEGGYLEAKGRVPRRITDLREMD